MSAYGYGKRLLLKVCYFTNWSQYRDTPWNYTPEDVNPNLCTHICYSFAKLDGNHLTAFEQNEKSMYKRMMALKETNRSLKILISLGGGNMGSAPFTAMVRRRSDRTDFIEHAIKWMRRHGFDGLDIDWEYPGQQDKDDFAALIKETRVAFDAESESTGNNRLYVTIAVAAGKDQIDAGYDVPKISKYADFITIMTYDLHGAWENFTGHNSPLYARSNESGYQKQLNMEWAAEYWVSLGAPRHKLNVGMAMYGRGFTLSNAANYQPGAPTTGPCVAGTYTREKGFLSYYEICDMINKGGTKHWIKEQEVPYVVKGDQWIGYDDPQSLAIKTNWARDNGYGGIAVWDMALDDYNGMYSQEQYPLLKSIVRTNCWSFLRLSVTSYLLIFWKWCDYPFRWIIAPFPKY